MSRPRALASSPLLPRAAAVLSVAVVAAAACGDDSEGGGGSSGSDAGVRPPDWRPMAVPSDAQLLGVWGRTSTEAYAVGWDGTALRWDGQTWIPETTTATVPLTAVAGSPAARSTARLRPVFAVGWRGTIVAREPSGRWVPAPKTSTTTADLFAVHLVAPDDGLAVGDRGTVLVWDGVSWQDVDFAITSELSGALVRPRTALAGVWSAEGERWVISGAGGASYRSAGGTATFEALDTLENVPLRGVWGPGGGPVYTVGLEGIVLRFTNRWRRDADDLPDTFLFGVWGRDDGDLTVVGWRGVIARRFGGVWFVENSGSTVDLRDVWVDGPTGAAFAVGARGTILTRTSTGAPRP